MTAVLMAITMLAMTSMVRAESNILETQTGKDIGLSLSSYRYQEPGYMTLTGGKIGLDLHVARVSVNGLIFRGEMRFAGGAVDYDSNASGSASGEPDWYLETRALLGKDWAVRDTVLSPYAGLGYRYLFNDGRGITNTGYAGYRRQSNYLYLPIGIIHRMTLNDQARLESTLEYDQLIVGKQYSSLSDTGGGYSDISNNQNSGYGLKLSFMYQKDRWAFGPFFNYWNISQSDTAILIQYGVPVAIGVEPHNNTVEFGLKASQQF